MLTFGQSNSQIRAILTGHTCIERNQRGLDRIVRCGIRVTESADHEPIDTAIMSAPRWCPHDYLDG